MQSAGEHLQEHGGADARTTVKGVKAGEQQQTLQPHRSIRRVKEKNEGVPPCDNNNRCGNVRHGRSGVGKAGGGWRRAAYSVRPKVMSIPVAAGQGKRAPFSGGRLCSGPVRWKGSAAAAVRLRKGERPVFLLFLSFFLHPTTPRSPPWRKGSAWGCRREARR